jgi:hypothetical protein
MTVFRNVGQWDTSNVLHVNGRVLLYDKRRAWSTRGWTQRVDHRLVTARLLRVTYALRIRGQLAGFEVAARF